MSIWVFLLCLEENVLSQTGHCKLFNIKASISSEKLKIEKKIKIQKLILSLPYAFATKEKNEYKENSWIKIMIGFSKFWKEQDI